ncbi:hypothetical protein CALVIDRAFT_541269 [Calocera viscosa TUFC12733]|uniref:F-box domain-containing protein n=1 Tax=Calocera viscosa (strain TUFC12733) TaxID=1330018 RepID=A0A167HWZ0_CALVF|nr:hypothetical protein CALVIDRAFT_541269 [Calocera viscosa TUFC12733]
MIPRCESGDGTINWRPFVKFLNAFERNPQHLDVFELTLIWSTTDALGIQEISKALCRVLHWHPELVRIKTAWIPGDLLCTLSSLPQLQELDLIFPASYGDAAIHFSDEGFKVLRKFTSSSYWSGNLCQVLMSIASTKLENIDVEMNGARSMGDGALLLSPFVPAILKHAASLRCLRLHPAARGVTESWLRFRPVLQCSLMEDFEFVCDGFGLTDDEIDDIVNSWPLLKHLHVKPKEREVRLFMSTTQDERAARVSCRGLRRLAECSHLLSLTLPLDLTNPHNDNMDPQATPGISLHSPLHSLDIGRAPFDMDAPDELEDFLRSIFPQLRNLSFERRTVGATDHTGLHTLQTSNKRWHILSTMRCNFLLPVVRRLPYKLLRKNGTMTYTHGVVYRQYMG